MPPAARLTTERERTRRLAADARSTTQERERDLSPLERRLGFVCTRRALMNTYETGAADRHRLPRPVDFPTSTVNLDDLLFAWRRTGSLTTRDDDLDLAWRSAASLTTRDDDLHRAWRSAASLMTRDDDLDLAGRSTGSLTTRDDDLNLA